jgi:DNA repair protein RadC
MEKVKEIVRIKQEVKRGKGKYDSFKIHSPHDAGQLVIDLIGDEDREVFLVLVLNTKNMINAIHRCHIGSINASIVHPREVFKACILNNGTSLIVAHNHPSTEPLPSSEDIAITKRLREAGTILGIELLDHLVVGGNRFISLKERGYI